VLQPEEFQCEPLGRDRGIDDKEQLVLFAGVADAPNEVGAVRQDAFSAWMRSQLESILSTSSFGNLSPRSDLARRSM